MLIILIISSIDTSISTLNIYILSHTNTNTYYDNIIEIYFYYYYIHHLYC